MLILPKVHINLILCKTSAVGMSEEEMQVHRFLTMSCKCVLECFSY